MTPTRLPAFTALPLPTLTTSRSSLPQCSTRPNPMQDAQTAAQNAIIEGRKRARALMYGADGAFRGLADRRQHIEQLMRMSGGFAGRFNGGWGGGNGGHGDDDSEGNVDPSWGVAPSAHLLLRGKADKAYRIAVANIIAMSVALAPKQAFVDPTVPVVVILGWMGAQKKQLSKYAKFYEEMGYEVHCVFNNLQTAMFPPSSKAQAKRIHDFIEGQPEHRPVFVHAFSIGTGIYGLLLDSLRNETEKLDRFRQKVVGVVFDSGPAPIFPHDVAKGLHTVCPAVSKAVWEPLTNALFWVTKARSSYGKSEDALRGFQFPSPQLYFYSGDDKVIPDMKNAVEGFIEKNKQKGVEVYKKFWEKSVHASHMKVHPEEYLANLQSFVHRCMEVRTEKGLPALTSAK